MMSTGQRKLSTCKALLVIDGRFLFQDRLFITERLDTIFRTFCIQHDRKGIVEFFPHLFDHVDLLLMFLVRTVREIQSCNVHARPTQSGQCFFVLTGGTDGTYYFRFSYMVLPHDPIRSASVCVCQSCSRSPTYRRGTRLPMPQTNS